MLSYREKTISCAEEQNNFDNAKEYKLHVTEVEELLIKIIDKFKVTEKNK